MRIYRYRLILTAILGIMLLAGCTQTQTGGAPTDVSKDDAIKLDGVQVREYKGEMLGSVDDFRENSIKGPQTVDRTTYRLKVTGLVDNPKSYTYSQVASDHANYEKVVQLDCVEGWSVKALWRGVLVRDLMNEAGVRPSATTVILRAVDGYSTSMPLSYFKDNDILLAYSINGVTLPAERGFPFQLVAEDKWGYKWIKWVDSIELSNDSSFKGYWEKRGYSNSGALNE